MNRFIRRSITNSTNLRTLPNNYHYPKIKIQQPQSSTIKLRKLDTLNSFSIRYSSSSDSLKCSKCGTKLQSHSSIFCSSSSCSKIQKLDPRKCNIYELFNLGPMNYDIDLNVVDTNYRNLQKLVHPDKFIVNKSNGIKSLPPSAPSSSSLNSSASSNTNNIDNDNKQDHDNKNDIEEDDRIISLENSAFINHANHLLKSPVERAFYIVSNKKIVVVQFQFYKNCCVCNISTQCILMTGYKLNNMC